MPSNHTQNYNLSQWEPEDKVLRTDFNADNLAIDEAIKAQADALAAEKTAREAAAAAEAASRTALDAAVSKLGNCQVEAFSVDLGPSGGQQPTLNFTVAPEVFLISGTNFFIGSRHMTYMRRFSSSGASAATETVSVTWSGSTCTMANRYGGNHYAFAFYRKDR